MEENIKLTMQDKRDLVVQAGLNAIPYIGGSLSSLYFGAKQERRFKRIENFYLEIKDDVDKLKDKIIDLQNVNHEELASLIEEINEGIENDFITEKTQYFKNCFLNALTTTSDDNFRKRKYFIHALSIMNEADISLIATLYKVPDKSGYKIEEDDDKFAEFNSSLEKLKSYGFVHSSLNGTLKPGINWGEISLYTISHFGKDFSKFCLDSPIE